MLSESIPRPWRPYRLAIFSIGLSLLAVVGDVGGGEFNAVLSIGDVAPRWQSLEGVDGEMHSWDDVAGAECVVVAFTCNSCPYAVDVEDRLIALSKQFPADAVKLVAINVNLIDDDLLPAMKTRAQIKSFPFAYLHDPSQQIARDFGAIRTPEFFVLDAEGRIVYMGSLDDSPDGKSVGRRYVADAVAAVLAGERVATQETVPIGCRIRYSRASRRGR